MNAQVKGERYMEEFVLRELTQKEREKLDSFIADESTELYQYFLAIITTDLIPEGEVSWEKALRKIAGEHTLEPPFCICGVIDAWIRLCMAYKSYGLVDLLDIKQIRGLKTSIDAIVYGFTNCIYYDGHIGSIGKKQNDLERNYMMTIMKGIPWYENIPVDVEPEMMYRFIMTTIEKLGFHLMPQSDNSRNIDLKIYKGLEF